MNSKEIIEAFERKISVPLQSDSGCRQLKQLTFSMPPWATVYAASIVLGLTFV